jgi:hypothetical protein
VHVRREQPRHSVDESHAFTSGEDSIAREAG